MPKHPTQHLHAVDAGQVDVEHDEIGRVFLERVKALLGGGRLAHDDAIELEIDANERAHARVVIDDEHDGISSRARSRTVALDERVEVGTLETAMAARCIEHRKPTAIGPHANRALGDAQVLRGLPKR